MTSIHIELVFEGAAVESKKMDAGLLAESLSGYSQLYRRANQIANGSASESAVFVESDFKSGSFVTGLELVQTIAKDADHLITAYQYLSAGDLAVALGFVAQNSNSILDSLIGLWKWLKGEKPDKIEQTGDNNYEITLGQNKKTVSNVTMNFYGDAAIRAAIGQLVQPLRQADIDRLVFKSDKREQIAIEKSEAKSFKIDPLELMEASTPMEGERDTVLIVSKLSFTEGTTWTFYEQGATLTAKIDDEEFWQGVHQHKFTFGEGDRLRVRVKWRVVEGNKRKLIAKNTIVKVYEVLPRPIQLQIDTKVQMNTNQKRHIRLPGKNN